MSAFASLVLMNIMIVKINRLKLLAAVSAKVEILKVKANRKKKLAERYSRYLKFKRNKSLLCKIWLSTEWDIDKKLKYSLYYNSILKQYNRFHRAKIAMLRVTGELVELDSEHDDYLTHLL